MRPAHLLFEHLISQGGAGRTFLLVQRQFCPSFKLGRASSRSEGSHETGATQPLRLMGIVSPPRVGLAAMSALRILAGFAILLVVGAGAFVAYAWRSAIGPVDPPARASFDPALVSRGADLAAIGNCNVCHTAPGGMPFAGGSRHSDTLRNDLFDQHHARSRDGHRPLVGGSFHPVHARGRGPGRAASLSRLPV